MLSSTRLQKCQTAALVAVCLSFFLLAQMFAPDRPYISNDSVDYMGFAARRPAAYPIFLSLIGRLDGQLSMLSIIQLFVLCVSALFFSVAVNRLTGRVFFFVFWVYQHEGK
jgi:hypothetical protein